MIEKVVLDHLATALSPTPVYMETPEVIPAKYVLVEKTGGGSVNFVKSASFAVQSYDSTLYKAAQLNELVKAAMDSLPTEAEVYSSVLNSDYNFTNPTTKQYRYQCIYDIKHY